MTAPSLVDVAADGDEFGELSCRWIVGAGVEVLRAPRHTTAQLDILADLDRDPDDSTIVVLTPQVRYAIGDPHPLYPRTVWLHRITP